MHSLAKGLKVKKGWTLFLVSFCPISSFINNNMQYHLPHLPLFPSSATTASSFAREKRRSTIWVPLFCTTTTDIDAMNIVRVVAGAEGGGGGGAARGGRCPLWTFKFFSYQYYNDLRCLMCTPLTQKTKKVLSIHDTLSHKTSPPITILIYKTNGSHLLMIKKKNLYIE